jgi:adhesin transport system outer membrane protein
VTAPNQKRRKFGVKGCSLRSLIVAGVCSAILVPASANAMSLKAAIKIAIEANPEIGEAVANRQALEFELSQARGLYAPSVDLEARYGSQGFSSPITRETGTYNDGRDRREVRGLVTQRVFDGFNRRAERHYQASRVDGASYRVYERSESIALNVIREYLEAGRVINVVRYAEENLAYHRKIYGDLKEGESSGSISVADRQQAEERLYAAEARLIEATEDLNSAKIRFFRLVGKPLDSYVTPPSVTALQPRTLPEALGTARQNHPLIKSAKADLDAARALIKRARSGYFPKLDIELLGRQGYELEGVIGRESELRAELVMRWNLFRGGIDRANVQEQVRRSDEERYGLRGAHREVEETVRLSWDRRNQQRRRYARLRDQLASTERLIESYGEQFKVGDRSLLDLLDTQNTRFNTQVSAETARAAYELAEYRVLHSTGLLLQKLGVAVPEQSDAYARSEQGVPETPAGETEKRFKPSHRWFTRSSR